MVLPLFDNSELICNVTHSRHTPNRIFQQNMCSKLLESICLVMLTCSLLVGCSDSSLFSTVEGKVKVDDKAIPKGQIIFSPLDGGQAVSADILDGLYRAKKVPRGANRVHLNAFYLTGKTFMELGIEYPEEKNLIPQKYLMGIELNISEPLVSHDFELTAK